MQTLMWVILAGTVGLAQLVTNHQRRYTAVTLSAPKRLGPIIVRVPEGWTLSQTLTKDDNLIDCVDPDTGRMLRIFVMRTPSAGDEPQDAEPKTGGLASEPIDFRGLGVKSSMTVERQSRVTADGIVTTMSLSATAQLPSGISVAIELDEIGTRLASADKSLVRAVANAITLGRGKRFETPPADRPQSETGDVD
jgi:hypothetical protein